jgi:outer membrane protein assembly factor BamA
MRRSKQNIWGIVVVVVVILATSCVPTRFVPENKQLLVKNSIDIEYDSRESKALDKADFEDYLKQKPNKKHMRLFRFRLAAYNFAYRGQVRDWKIWLANVVGEPPVILDSMLLGKTQQQFFQYLKNQAYYNSAINVEVKTRRKKAKVKYSIVPNEPLKVGKLQYTFLDPNIKQVIIKDSVNGFLREGRLFSLENIKKERNRITTVLKENGYYDFTREYVRFEVDTFSIPSKAHVNLIVDEFVKEGEGVTFYKTAHKQYYIDQISYYPNYNPQEAIRDYSGYIKSFDTLQYNGFNFIYSKKKNVKPQTILRASLLNTGELYNKSKLQQTLDNYSSIKLYRLRNIDFEPSEKADSLLNAKVLLSPLIYQGYSFNTEITNAKGNIGLGGAVSFYHRNLFKGAEYFSVKLSGAYQMQGRETAASGVNVFDAGVEAKLEVPTVLFPYRSVLFSNKRVSSTVFSMGFHLQKYPQFTHKIAFFNMGYRWKQNKKIRHTLTPFDFGSVQADYTDSYYESFIQGTYQEKKFQDYFIASGRYSLFYQGKEATRKVNHSRFRFNYEMAGNLPVLVMSNLTDTVSGGYYEVFNTRLAQYLKADVDYRYYFWLNENNSLAFRLFGGCVFPYGNAEAVPYVKQYYAGGSESIRAWGAQELGPGSYKAPARDRNSIQTADLKLEFNMEYRYTIYKWFKGALFVDGGNIWSIKKEDRREGAAFSANSFYRQIALGTGTGVRLDFSYAIIRLDLGLKMFDPAQELSEAWVLFNRPFEFNQVVVNFGVGYPF